MESKKIGVFYHVEAENSISKIGAYIEENGYPETAERFADRLYAFGESLLIFSDKYPVCRFPKLAKRHFRCAVFEQNYIFIYKMLNKQLIIYNVIHGRAISH